MLSKRTVTEIVTINDVNLIVFGVEHEGEEGALYDIEITTKDSDTNIMPVLSDELVCQIAIEAIDQAGKPHWR